MTRRQLLMGLGAGVVGVAWGGLGRVFEDAAVGQSTTRPAGGKRAAVAATQGDGPLPGGFRKNVRVELTDAFYIVHSDGIPDHTTGVFPNPRNPNRIQKQHYTFRIPRHPKRADRVTPTPMGPIGVAINGVPFYNPYTAEGTDAAKNEVFDECCGHPDGLGRYHYHIYPKCIHTSFHDTPGEHSPLIGYAFDGYGIYGPFSEGGKRPTDLDACNGHTDPVRGYHYHVTNKFPHIIGGYRGVVERSNFDHGPRDGQGRPMNGPGGRRRPPRGGPRRGYGGPWEGGPPGPPPGE